MPSDSDLAEAFTELQESQSEATGTRQRVKIGRKFYDAIIETITENEVFVAGGVSENGGFRVIVAMSDFSDSPKKFTAITVPGSDPLQILSVNPVNGVTYEITAGDPTQDQR